MNRQPATTTLDPFRCRHRRILGAGILPPLAVALREAGIGPKWFFPVGIFSGLLIAATAYEQYNNIEVIDMINGGANTIWFIWFAAIGWVLIKRSGNLVKVQS